MRAKLFGLTTKTNCFTWLATGRPYWDFEELKIIWEERPIWVITSLTPHPLLVRVIPNDGSSLTFQVLLQNDSVSPLAENEGLNCLLLGLWCSQCMSTSIGFMRRLSKALLNSTLVFVLVLAWFACLLALVFALSRVRVFGYLHAHVRVFACSGNLVLLCLRTCPVPLYNYA